MRPLELKKLPNPAENSLNP